MPFLPQLPENRKKGDFKFWDDKLGMTAELEAAVENEKLDAAAQKDELNLNEYSLDSSEVEKLCKASLDFLAAVSMPTLYEYEFPPVLQAAWQLILQVELDTNKRFPQIALGIPRGHAKTTLLKLAVLYIILFTRRRFILILGATEAHAINILSDIADMLDEINIVRAFGDWKYARETNSNTVKKFNFRGRDIVLGAIGQGGSVRGLNLKNSRPDVMVFDDVQTKECAESAIMSDSLMRWMIGTAMKAKSPRGCMFLFAGNMFPGPNSILKKLKNNPTWIKFISGAILADGTALWPEHRSLQDLIEELDNDISMGHPEIFFSEVLNDTDAGINTRTDIAQIKPWPWQSWERPQGKFIIIDPAADKKNSDAVSIGYFEVYDGIPGMREMIQEQMSPGNTIRNALLLALRNRVKVIAVESTSYQYSLLYWFGEIANKLNLTGIHFVEVNSGMVSKNSRIALTLQSLTKNEIAVHEDVRHAVVHEIANWNPLKRDNLDGALDLLTYAPKVQQLYGPIIADELELQALEGAGLGVQEDNHAF